MVDATSPERAAMYSSNRLKIGLFGANCSSGRAVTMVPERWSGAGRTISSSRAWRTRPASTSCCRSGAGRAMAATPTTRARRSRPSPGRPGLLASTKRITVFGTVHAPLFNPVIAAKEMVTADHIGEGRFGLNIVVGWNEGEFEMFGVEQREHEQRYEYAQEWIDVIKMIWSDKEDFDFDGKYLDLKGIRGKPKPYGGARPVIMNAGASPIGQAFAIRNCDAFFLQASRTSLDETAARRSRTPRTRPRSRAASSASIPSASSPAGRPRRRPRTTTTTPSSSTPTGRRSTASWRSRTSRAQNTPPEKFQQLRTGLCARAWAACRSSAIPTTSRADSSTSARPA